MSPPAQSAAQAGERRRKTPQDAAGLSFIGNLPLVPRGGLHIESEARSANFPIACFRTARGRAVILLSIAATERLC